MERISGWSFQRYLGGAIKTVVKASESNPDQLTAGFGPVRSDALRFELWAIAFVLSAGMLGYEILPTRVASVLLATDHLFLVLAFALLDLALGARCFLREPRTSFVYR